MELPHIGEHCAQLGCHHLDFLPITCNLCGNKYCNDHHRYEDHQCPEQYKLDVRVPICPLCDNPVPSKRGLAPDLAVNEHMENNCCQKDKKIYKNRCSFTGCRIKELIAIQCDLCNLNYCLRHRHTIDHDCKGSTVAAASRRERTLNGSIFQKWMNGHSSGSNSSSSIKSKSNQKPLNNIKVNNGSNHSVSGGILRVSPSVMEAVQGDMSEEEAIRKAILYSQAEGVQQNPGTMSEDEQLARAIALSLEQQNSSVQNKQGTCSKVSDCTIS